MKTKSSIHSESTRPNGGFGTRNRRISTVEDAVAEVLRRARKDGVLPGGLAANARPASESIAARACAQTVDNQQAAIENNHSTARGQSLPVKQLSGDRVVGRRAHIIVAAIMLLAWCSAARAASISFSSDPFEGTSVRDVPGRQVVGGELFIAFHTDTESFVFDDVGFGMGSQIHFANGVFNAIPPSGVNAVVLQSTDNDENPLTPFGAANAADLLASRIADPGAGVFVYFNSSLNLARLVYSSDLSSNTADLKILARILNLTGREGITALPTFSAENFEISNGQTVPEPSTFALFGVGISLVVTMARNRRRT
jgi:hypothetical protein